MSAMTNTPNDPTPAAAVTDEEPEEVTGYGYLTEAETAAAIKAHEAEVKKAQG